MSIERYDPGSHQLNDTAVDHWNRYLFARRWVRGPSVLDVGCGTGYGTEILGEPSEVESVVGVDRSYEALFSAISRNRSRKVTFVHTHDATFMPLTSHWGTVVALEVWEHLRCPRTAALCARIAMPGTGRLVVSLPIDEQQGKNEYHLHCFTVESARSLVSEFFDVRHEYHQNNNVTFVANPRGAPVRAGNPVTVIALLQVYGGKNGAYRSAAQEIVELRRDGMNVVVLCDDPQLVREHTGAEAFLLPLESSFRGEGQVSPVHLSAACAFAQWFDANVIYAAHEFMPLARAMADIVTIPTVMHLRGLPSAGWYEGAVSPKEALPRSPRCLFVANSVSTADQYARALRCNLEKFPIVSPRIDFAALHAHNEDTLGSGIAAVAVQGPMLLFVAAMRNTVKGFEQFLAVAEQVEATYPRGFTFGVVADEGNWSDADVLRRLTARGVDPSRIFISAATDAIGAAYRAAAVCVIPSERSESFCRVAAEALEQGLPVVGFRGGHLNSFERFGAVLVERGEISKLAEAAVSAARGRPVTSVAALRRAYGIERPSKLPEAIASTVEKAQACAERELIVAVASDGLSLIASSDWVERMCLLASHGTRVLLVLSTSSDDVERVFVESAGRTHRPYLRVGVVRRDATEQFVFARAINRAVNYGFGMMPRARGVLCVNDDTWPSHLALTAVLSWLETEGLVGGVCPAGAGGDQECPGFFRELFSWGTRFLTSDHRLSAFWLYLSREAWVALDGFDEGFKGYGCDDTDLCLRAWQLRQPIRIDRSCYVDHDVADSYARTTDVSALRDEAIRRFTIKHAMSRDMYHVPLRLMKYREGTCK